MTDTQGLKQYKPPLGWKDFLRFQKHDRGGEKRTDLQSNLVGNPNIRTTFFSLHMKSLRICHIVLSSSLGHLDKVVALELAHSSQ